MTPPTPRTWLGPALAVALLWAPLPGMAAVWFAVRAEAARRSADPRLSTLSARARLWVWISVGFGVAEIVGVGIVGLARWVFAWAAT